jgi:predicted MFS family arabinose efflux permease
MYTPFILVFFQHVTRLPLAEIGAVLGVAGLVGMAALPIAGSAVDRWGARRMQLAGYGVRGAAFVAYPFAHSIVLFAILAVVTAAATRAFPAIQQAVISDLVTGPTGTGSTRSAAASPMPASAPVHCSHRCSWRSTGTPDSSSPPGSTRPASSSPAC